MLSVRKVLSVLALGVLALSASSVEAGRMSHHRSAQVAQQANATGITARAILEEEFQSEFTKFMKVHDKEYSVDDLFVRYNIFKDNYKFIVQQNAEADAGVHSHRCGVTALADMTNEEFRSKMLGHKSEFSSVAPALEEFEVPAEWTIDAANIPASVDWRQHNRVTGVKNQAQCGSCWSFGSTAAMESAHAAHTGQLVSLSEQQLVDCAGSSYGCGGCNGGNIEGAYSYVKAAGGQASESAYAYTAKNGNCKGVQGGAKSKISGYTRLPADEGQIATAVANVGTIAVALDGGDPNFQHYTSGVFDGSCGTQRDHAVAIVGYGNQSGKDTWIVKNSWGNWGQGGYIIMRRGVNKCGINGDASYPTASA